MLRKTILGALTIAAGVGAAFAVKLLMDADTTEEEKDLFDEDDEVRFIHIDDGEDEEEDLADLSTIPFALNQKKEESGLALEEEAVDNQDEVPSIELRNEESIEDDAQEKVEELPSVELSQEDDATKEEFIPLDVKDEVNKQEDLPNVVLKEEKVDEDLPLKDEGPVKITIEEPKEEESEVLQKDFDLDDYLALRDKEEVSYSPEVMEICSVYPYLSHDFVKQLLDKNDYFEENYPEDTLITIEHKAKFSDEEGCQAFSEIMENFGYECHQEEGIVSAKKKMFTQSGAIISDVLNVSNQTNALDGKYLEYGIEK